MPSEIVGLQKYDYTHWFLGQQNAKKSYSRGLNSDYLQFSSKEKPIAKKSLNDKIV
jgi:hypothetical protein